MTIIFRAVCRQENVHHVTKLCKEAGVNMYHALDFENMRYFKDLKLVQDWITAGDDSNDKVTIFGMTTLENATAAKEMVDLFNRQIDHRFPVRTFIMTE